MSPQAVLDFWFKESTPQQWFTKDAAFDATIKERFERVYWDIVHGKTEGWRATPEGRLAEVIVLDQFARNMFRGSPQAFAADVQALQLAEEAVRLGADKQLSRMHRTFLYMPHMHSESRKVHKKAPWLFLTTLNLGTFLYELKHKKIIDRFGRYPHRNAVLGRQSTPEEEEFLKINKGF